MSADAPAPRARRLRPHRSRAALAWGLVGFTMGVLIAFQLAFPVLNLGTEWTTFGRLRPVHTSAVVFALAATP